MSNEELAVLAYSGNNVALGELYQNCYRFIYKASYSYYVLRQNRLSACGVQLEDMLSEAYFAIPEAVKAFNEQETQYKFITFLSYPLLNCFNGLAGLTTSKKRKEPLNVYKSLDEVVPGTDDLILSDTIMDETLPDEDELTENIVLSKVFPLAAEILPEDEYRVLKLRFEHNMSYSDIGKVVNTTVSGVGATQNRALRKLRASKQIKELGADIIDATYHLGSFEMFERTNTSST